MAKPRLKVFRAQMGFAEAIVAAPNQRAALKAWGARQNLFAEGLAGVCDDPGAVKAATGRPGEVLQRAIGSSDPWADVSAPPVVPASKRNAPSRKASHEPKKAAQPAPDRTRLTAAERMLANVEAQERKDLAGVARQREALEREETAIRTAAELKRKAAQRALNLADKAYRAAGGQ